MKNTCPQTGRAIRLAAVKVYAGGEFICDVTAEQAVEGLACGLYGGVGSKRSIHALVILKRPNDEFAGPIPTQRPTSYEEHVGDSYVWQHSHSAKMWLSA